MLLFKIVDTLFSGYFILLSVAIISSWFPELQEFQIIRFVRRCTDPYLSFFRRFVPPLGPLDLSPIVAFFALQFLEMFIKRLILS